MADKGIPQTLEVGSRNGKGEKWWWYRGKDEYRTRLGERPSGHQRIVTDAVTRI